MDQGTLLENKDQQSCHSCMLQSILAYSIMLPSNIKTIKIFQKIAELLSINKQEGHEALNRSPEYTGQSQTFNFEIWMTFGQVQRMTLTFDTHSTSLTHLAECFK